MNQLTRLQILEEICTKVAEDNVTQDLILKAFNLQSKKKRGQIKPKEARIVKTRTKRKAAE
jgi:hypothetical protein